MSFAALSLKHLTHDDKMGIVKELHDARDSESEVKRILRKHELHIAQAQSIAYRLWEAGEIPESMLPIQRKVPLTDPPPDRPSRSRGRPPKVPKAPMVAVSRPPSGDDGPVDLDPSHDEMISTLSRIEIRMNTLQDEVLEATKAARAASQPKESASVHRLLGKMVELSSRLEEMERKQRDAASATELALSELGTKIDHLVASFSSYDERFDMLDKRLSRLSSQIKLLDEQMLVLQRQKAIQSAAPPSVITAEEAHQSLLPTMISAFQRLDRDLVSDEAEMRAARRIIDEAWQSTGGDLQRTRERVFGWLRAFKQASAGDSPAELLRWLMSR